MPGKTLHFKSFSGYKKWLAYKNIHGLNRGNRDTIYIHGHKHRVEHA